MDSLVKQYLRAVYDTYKVPMCLSFKLSSSAIREAQRTPSRDVDVFAQHFANKYTLARREDVSFVVCDELVQLERKTFGAAKPVSDFSNVKARKASVEDEAQVKMIAEAFAHYDERA